MKNLSGLLEKKYRQYNSLEFIENDPVSIPHKFTRKQDIEIMGFWTAMLSWGQRQTIINKCNELIDLMDGSPFEFISSMKPKDVDRFSHFKHRTFNFTDTQYFLRFFKWYYSRHESLEEAFCESDPEMPMESALINFHHLFFSLSDAPLRTRKHVSTPERNSTCKRLNMFLRWMVRKEGEVDLGIWETIDTKDLLCPLDVHTERVGRRLRLINRKQKDWHTVVELTNNLKKYDENDPVKYDFALFGMGIFEDNFN